MAGCAGRMVPPFDGLKTAPVVVYRLQNWEPPTQATAPSVSVGGGLIPPLPPILDGMVKAGASVLPPVLVPPGLLGGNAAPSAQPDATARFHGFRIIGSPVSVMDDRARQELVDILGFESNFDNSHGACVNAEFGVSFARVGLPPADVLVSVSCDQVQSQNFIWPHRFTGLTAHSSDRLVRLMTRMFGPNG